MTIKSAGVLFWCIFLFCNIHAQQVKGLYMGQEPPGLEPKIFMPDFVSKPDRHEFGSVFSNDGREFYFGVDRGGRSEILFSRLSNDRWIEPEVILSDDQYSFNDPMLSVDEDRLYFISDMPLNGDGEKKDIDIWYVEREVSGWSQPRNAGDKINSSRNEYYISFTNEGTLYFSSNSRASEDKLYNFDIYNAAILNDVYQEPKKLPEMINTDRYEADVFVAPDESYMIFCAIRKEGFGKGDLYISFRNGDGSWSEAKNMGGRFNNELHQLCPFVTQDGKYLFFTSNQDIYWVSATIINEYRK